jgi:hypothetical protein
MNYREGGQRGRGIILRLSVGGLERSRCVGFIFGIGITKFAGIFLYRELRGN